MKNYLSRLRSLSLIATAFALIIQMSSCSERIDAGHEGLKIKDYGQDKGVSEVTLVTGRVWYNPFTERVVEGPTFVKTIDYKPFTVDAKGGGTFTIDPTINVRMRLGQFPSIYTKYRLTLDEVYSTIVYTATVDAYRIEFNKHDVDWIVNNREELETNVETSLKQVLFTEGFDLERLTHGIQPPSSITEAINDKNTATQKALKKVAELQEVNAQAQIDLVKAKTAAETNRLRQQTLTPLLIQDKLIDKWDGHSALYGMSPMFFKNIN